MITLDMDHSQPQTPRTARPSMSSLVRHDSASTGHSANGFDDGMLDHNTSDVGRSIPFPSLDESLSQPSAADLDHHQAREFWKVYVEHSSGLLDSVKSYRFDQVCSKHLTASESAAFAEHNALLLQFELSLRTFWAGLDQPTREVVSHPVMMSLVYRADAVVYDVRARFPVRQPPWRFVHRHSSFYRKSSTSFTRRR